MFMRLTWPGLSRLMLIQHLLNNCVPIHQVLLQIERAYGSQGNLQVWYSTHGGSALPGSDFVSINQAALTMDSQETTLSIVIQVGYRHR